MKEINENELINSININDNIAFFLGAGCSISSGCMAANKLIQEFKKRIYCTQNGIKFDENTNFNLKELDERIFEYFKFDNYKNAYSYYFEKCYPLWEDRNIFIKEKFKSVEPGIGYLYFANYLLNKRVKTIFTTNFDNLIEKALKRLNPNIDLLITSDNIKPCIGGDIYLYKLHGDYNYERIKNTDEELTNLDPILEENANNAIFSRLVVLGYSGQDETVKRFLRSKIEKQNVKIIWCAIDEAANYTDLFDELGNDNIIYCKIKGFDELFDTFYKTYGIKNQTIDDFIYLRKNENFEMISNYIPEKIITNCHPIIDDLKVYVADYSFKYEKYKEINDNQPIFILDHEKKSYFIGNKEVFEREANFFDVKEANLSEMKIGLNCKIKLIKEYVKLSARNKGYKVIKDTICFGKQEDIEEGLKVSVDVFEGKLSLITSVNYVYPYEINNSIKARINSLKSNLFAKQNYCKRIEFENKLFSDNLSLSFNGQEVHFDNTYSNNSTPYISNINCSHEPYMCVENNSSINQIKLLNESGPKSTAISPDVIKVGIFCVQEDYQDLQKFISKLQHGSGTYSKSGSVIPEYPGFEKLFKKKIDICWNTFDKPIAVNALYKNASDVLSFANLLLRAVEKAFKKGIDLLLIYLGDNLVQFKRNETFDLHDYVKLKCFNAYKTQFLEQNTLYSSDDINKKLFNLGIAIYTKTIGIPWHPRDYEKNTLYIGLGFGVTLNGVLVGCSQMFDGAGRGMRLIVSKISKKIDRKNQYLSFDEAYNLGKKIQEAYYKTSKIEPLKKVVIHRLSGFRKEEIDGFKKAFINLDDFDLIEISLNTNFNANKLKNNQCDGFPLKRGTTIKCSKMSAYLWLDGSINEKDINNGWTYRNNSRGMGNPIKITKYYGMDDVNSVVDDLMKLSKMDFNSSDVIYSKLPITIKYASKVCDILKQGEFSDEFIDFEYIM